MRVVKNPGGPGIWLVGNKGMLGREVAEALEESDFDFVGTDRELDITDAGVVEAYVRAHVPGVIINCAAYTAVDKAEDNSEAAFQLNGKAPGYLATAAAAIGARLIHISTDYVFPGTRDLALGEEEATGPIGVYGKSKLAGEEAVVASGCRYDIVRTAWLYGKHGPNFVATMIRLMNERDSLKVVADQVGSPTSATDLAVFLVELAGCSERNSGIYHYSNEGRISWYDFALAILEEGQSRALVASAPAITPCGSDEYPTKATRPAFSLLSKEKAKREFNLRVPEWRDSLERYLDDMLENNGEK